LRRFIKAHDMGVARLAQGVFQDRRPDGILVDDDDLERGLHGASGNFQASCQSRAGPEFLSCISLLQVPIPLAPANPWRNLGQSRPPSMQPDGAP